MSKLFTESSVAKEYIIEYLSKFEHLPYGVAMVKNDAKATLLEANMAFYDMIGHTKEELWENHENRVSEILVDHVYSTLEKHSMEEDFDIVWDLRLRTADGSVRWTHHCAHYLSKLDVFIILVTDITDKMIADTVDLSFDAFQTRNEILAYVSKYTTECIVVTDAETDEIVYMN